MSVKCRLLQSRSNGGKKVVIASYFTPIYFLFEGLLLMDRFFSICFTCLVKALHSCLKHFCLGLWLQICRSNG